MYWCVSCQEYVEPIYTSSIIFPTGPRCPNCKRGVSNTPPGEPEPYVNNGNHNVTDFGWNIAARSGPVIDALLATYHQLERQVNELPVSDLSRWELIRQRDLAKARAMAWLLDHKDDYLFIAGN